MASTTVQFSQAQAQLAKYGYERLVYTPWPFAGTGATPSLANGTTQIFRASNWNGKGRPTRQAALEMLQTTQNADVNLLWTNDQPSRVNTVNTGQTIAARAGQRQMPTYRPAVDTLSLSLQNLTGAAVDSWNTAYAVSTRPLTAADKLLAKRSDLISEYGAYNLSAGEVAAFRALGAETEAEIHALVDKGTSPVSLQRAMSGLYDNRVTDGGFDLFYPTVDASDTIFATYNSSMDPTDPTRGRFVVLTDVAIESAANVTVSVDRDGQFSYLQLQGAAFQQTDDEPWHVWVPAMSSLVLHVTQGPNSAATEAAVRVRVREYELSEVLAVQFGLVNNPSGVSKPSVYYKTILGLI